MPTAAADLRIAVIGCGSIGRRHLRNLRALGVAKLVAFDPQTARRDSAARELGVAAAESLDAVWASRPDAAVIAVPTHLHTVLALQAAEHGCHLFVEKPVSDGRDEPLSRLLQLAAQQRLVTLVGCNLRFHPGLVAVKRLLAAGAIGKVTGIGVQFGQYLPDWHPQEDYRFGYSAQRAAGGGIILDAIHELDYMRWLAGEITEVSCFAGKLSRLEIETEDTAVLLLRFAAGTLGHAHLDYVQRAYHRACRIIGEEGTITWDYAGQTALYTAASGRWSTQASADGWQPNQMYADEMKHFLSCLNGEAQPALDLPSAVQVLAVALAAKKSAASGQPVRVAAPEAAALAGVA